MNISNNDRAQILAQALPYIQKYAGKTIVVKYGGNAMINEEIKSAVMTDIVLMQSVGINVVLVHGGGPEINTMLSRVGKESKFIGGFCFSGGEKKEKSQKGFGGKKKKIWSNIWRTTVVRPSVFAGWTAL